MPEAKHSYPWRTVVQSLDRCQLVRVGLNQLGQLQHDLHVGWGQQRRRRAEGRGSRCWLAGRVGCTGVALAQHWRARLAALLAAHAGPGAVVKGLARRCHRALDIGLVALGNLQGTVDAGRG